MKILYIADSTSIHTQRWLRYFLDRGNEIYIVTLGRKTKKLQGVHHLANFECFYYGSPSFINVLFQTRKIIRQVKPDILHAHFVHQYGWLAALSGFHPFVLTAWGTDILNLPRVSRSGFGRWLTTYSLKKADQLTATSNYLKSEMNNLGADEEKIEVIFWGVDYQKFHPSIPTQKLRRELMIETEQPVILSNRNQIDLYNNDIVINAMDRILKYFPETVLLLQNSGGNQEEALKVMVRDKKMEKSVRFLGPFPHDDMPSLYALAEIFISVPTWDAGPVSLKEAMSCGAVPVISDVSGPKEWVQDEVNGKIVPIRNPVRLADAVCGLLRDKEKCERFRLINRRLVMEKAGHGRLMQKVERLYFNLIKEAQ